MVKESAMNVDIRRLSALFERLTPDESWVVLQFAEFLIQQRESKVDARTAKRKVSAWLVREVGNLLMGDTPQYIPGERPVWRVPVLVTSGRRGHAAFVDVDAQSGDLLIDDYTPEKVLADVQAFVNNTASN
jgi:hypothetical protein